MVGMVEWREWQTEWLNAEWQEWWNGKNGGMTYGGMAYETE
jgi:hypothetical protein